MFSPISARIKLLQAKRREIRAKIHRTLIFALIAPLFVTISAPPSLGLPSIPSAAAPSSTPEVKSPFNKPISLKTSAPIIQSSNLNTSGLVARFDAKTYASYSGSGTSWSDISGNGLSAAFTNKSSPLTSDYTSGGVTFKGIGFDGVNQYATINSSLNATYSSGLSISFFANFGSVANNYERIIDIGNGPSSENILVARESTTNNLIGEVYSGTGSVGWCRVLNAIPATAIWAHYAFVFNGTTCSLYKDGSLYTGGSIQRWSAGSAAATSSTGTVAYTGLPSNGSISRPNAWIGRSNWSGDAYFEGAIADVAVFNRALTATDVSEWRVDQMSSTVHAGAGVCPNRVANPASVTVTSVVGDCVVRFSAPSNTTTSNTWIVPSGVTTAKVLTVAGGGGGGAWVGAGGGAGGFIESITSVTATSAISLSVGAGGAGGYKLAANTTVSGANGANSTFGSSFTALGGGKGAAWDIAPSAGGSGGGGSSEGSTVATGAAATNASQGFAGGSKNAACTWEYGYATGGGGGAGGVGGSATCFTYSTSKSGDGGIGRVSDVTGTPTYYAGGGGGGIHGNGNYRGVVGAGGLGGGGAGAAWNDGVSGPVCATNPPPHPTGGNGTDGLGGGGGGAGHPSTAGCNSYGGRGGSGIVIIRYGSTSLSINSNGGSGFTGTTSFSGTTFSNITLPAQSGLARTGFTFGGWNTRADGTGTNYAAGSTYQLNLTTTLYAQWRSVISYDANGGTARSALDTTTALGSGATTTLIPGITTPGSIVTSGLQLHLDASNPASYPGTGSTWYDLSGNGRNATALNSPIFDPNTKSFRLNGVDQSFEFAASNFSYSGTANYTLATMFKSSNIGKVEQCLICRYHGGTAGNYLLRTLSGVPETYREGVASFPATGYMIGSSEYDYLVTTFNGTTVKIFLNGAEIYTGNNSGSASLASAIKTYIGRTSDNSRYFEGQIFSAQIYNVALSQSQIIQNYNALLPRAYITKDSSTLSGWSTTTDSSTAVIVGNSGTLLAGLPTPYIRLEAKNYDGTTWTPTNYNGNGITFSTVKPTKNTNQTGWGAAATFPTVSGLAANSVAIYLNNPELDSYTFCGMARYKTNGAAAPATMSRIFTGTSVDWLAGWYNANTKDFYHSTGYLNNSTTVDYNWHYLCDSGNNIYWDGVKLPVTNQTYTKLPTLAIGGAYANVHWSDFEITEVIIYNQFLSASQIAQVNQYFKSTYGVVAGAVETATPNMVPPTNFASTGTSTLYARWGSTITYDGNGQTSGTPPAPQVFANGVGNLATNSGSLAKAGYNFAGWNTRADGTGTLYAAGSSYSGPNLLLYAIYQVPVKFANTLAAAEPISLSPYMRFKADDYDATKKIWYDSSGNGRNTSSIKGAPTVSTTSIGNGSTKTFKTVVGATNLSGASPDGIKFNNPTFADSQWTVFSVARIPVTQNSTASRLFDGESGNLLFGFYGNSSGAMHNGDWITGTGGWTAASSNNIYGQNWVISTGQTDYYKGIGYNKAGTAYATNTGTGNGTTNTFAPLTINAGQYVGSDYSSGWEVAEVIMFDRKLTTSEMQLIQDYLANSYGISSYVRQQNYSESVTVNAAAGSVTLSDTYTATFGYRNTFSISPIIPGITMENTATNSVRIRIASTLSPGTYWETITATDAVGNTALLPVKIEVVPALQWSGSNVSTLVSTFGKYTRQRLDLSGGFGTRVAAVAHVSSPAPRGITLDTSTISSGYIHFVVDTGTAVGTYTESITVTDGSGLIKTTVLTLTINSPPDIAYSAQTDSAYPYVTQNLLLNLDAANSSSYTGSGTTWTDTAGNRAFTLSGSPTYSQSNGGTLAFATGKEAVSNTNWINLDTFTVETWFKLKTLSTAYPCFVTTTYTGSHINFAICQYGSAGSIYAGYHRGGGNGWQASTSATGVLAANTWYHAVYTVSKSGSTYTGTLFLNGRVLGSATSTLGPLTDPAPIRVGKRWDGTTEYIDGEIPVVRIYNSPLSAQQVQQNYQNSKVRFVSATSVSPTSSGNTSLTATAGTARDFQLFTANDGVGNKTLTLSGTNSSFRIDTSTANTAIFKVLSSSTSTNASTARTYSETLTAVDTNGIATAYYLSVTVNPTILITSTSDTITTTFGRTGSTTLNVAANTGTGSSTFTRVSSSGSSAITATLTAGQAILNVAGTLPAGTYYETFTATDSLGATASKVITIIVNAAMAIVPASGSTTFETTFTRATTARLNITGGTGNRTYAIAYPSSASRWRITLDTSTAASNFVTVRVDSFTATGTHSITVTVTDSLSATASTTLTLVVNDFPTLNNVKNDNSYVKPGLILNLDAANTLSSTGSGNWKDLSGAGSNAVFTSAPTYSSTNGGIFTFNGSANYLTFPSITTATSPGVTSGAFPEYTAETWVRFSYPTFSSFSGTACLICEAYVGTSGSINMALSIRNNGQIHSGYLPTTAINWVEATTAVGTVNTGIWYHIAATVVRSGNNYVNTIYLNGVAITSATSTYAPATSSRDYYIGRRWDSASQLLNGSIGVVRVYNRGLSQSEIQDNYNALSSRYINTSARSSTFITTQGASYSAAAIPATLGTGNKTLTLAPVISGITGDTSTANAIRVTAASTLAATDTQTARTYVETITATDIAGASITHLVNVTVNPPIILSAGSTSIATTSGIETSTVITATKGSSTVTFTRTGTSVSGITLTASSNQATLRVLSTINPGTYYETVTATDTATASTSIMFTIVVAAPPAISGSSRLETSKGVLFKSPLYEISGGTGTLTMSLTNSPTNANITLTGTSIVGGYLQIAGASETGTYTSTIRVTDARGAYSEIPVTVVVNAPVTLSGSLSITKTYGNATTNGYSTNGTGTAPFSFSATPVCAVIKTVSGSYTYEKINGTDSCTWTAPVGVTAVDALIVGAGGGGGGDGGSGGGGGSINTLSSVTLPANRQLTVQVGAGGTGGTWGGNNATSGGTTSITSGVTTYTAPGGSGGGGCGAAASAGGVTGSGGSPTAGGNGGFGGPGTGCGAGAGGAGSNGPSTSFTGSATNYGGGGGGGPLPNTVTSMGGSAGGAGGGGTGALAKGAPSYGLTQYFRTQTSTPASATSKQAFMDGTCAVITGNLNYASDADFPCSQKDNFQVYTEGYFIAPVSGSITFYMVSDDSSVFEITANSTVNALSRSSASTVYTSMTVNNFVAGQAYPVWGYFTEMGGAAAWKLEYSYAGQSQIPIPISQLRSSAEGLSIYFKTSASQPANARTKPVFTTGTCIERVSNINFAADADFPCSTKDNFQGYATGYFVAPYTGSIKFYTSSDDSSHMAITINGVTNEIGTDIGEASATYSGFIQGQYYPISAFFTEIGGVAAWKLEYEYTGQARTAIPLTYLRSTIDYTLPTAGTNGLGGGGGAGSAGVYKLNGAKGGSGTAIIKYLTQSDTATAAMITAYVNQESPSGLLTLNVPAYVTVGTYTQTIKVQDAANSAPYSATVTITVNKATPTTTISLPGGVTTAKYGTPVTLSVAASTAGNINFKKSGTTITNCSAVATTNGVATCSWTPNAVETATISALLTPTDSTNYNNSVETASAISILVGKADTLTITAGTPSAITYSSPITLPANSYTTSGLREIDSITAMSYSYSIISGGSCANGGLCSVGDIGPAGGVIIYVASSIIDSATGISTGGLYLEAAPSTFTPTPVTWCDVPINSQPVFTNANGSAIGTGASNTRLIAANCAGGAGYLAANATIGGYSDWFLPSALELDRVFANSDLIGITQTGYFHSSTERDQVNSLAQRKGFAPGGDGAKSNQFLYWPIRAFSSGVMTSPPTDAGTYYIYPATPTFNPGAASNYTYIDYQPGILVINKAPRANWSTTYNATTNVTRYGVGKTETATITYPGDGTKLFTTSSSVCSVGSETGTITTLGVGACDVQVSLSETKNWLSDTKTVTVTIDRGLRSATVTPAKTTIKYGETSTVTSTISPALDSATVIFSVGSFLGCSADNVTGDVTGIKAGASCAVSVTYGQTDLYESATASAAMTINKALAPVVTTETITAVSYTGNTALVTPTYRVSGVLARDILQIVPTADVSDISLIDPTTYSSVASYKYFATVPTSYDSTTAPTLGGTYSVTPQTLTLLNGVDISNYETPNYVSANLVIEPIAQTPLRILLSLQDSITVPYDITFSGGSSTGSVSVILVSGTSGIGCSVSGLRLTTSAPGVCVLQARKAADRNYLEAISETATVNVLNFVAYTDWNAVFNSGSGITITSQVPITVGPETCSIDCQPQISDVQDASGNPTTTLTVGAPLRIIGVDLNTTDRVLFTARINGVRLSSVPADSFQVDSPTQLTVMPPANFVPNTGENSSNITVRILVLSPGGSIGTEKIVIISL